MPPETNLIFCHKRGARAETAFTNFGKNDQGSRCLGASRIEDQKINFLGRVSEAAKRKLRLPAATERDVP